MMVSNNTTYNGGWNNAPDAIKGDYRNGYFTISNLSKVINILKKMREEEKNLIGTDIDTDIKDYTHGDKAEALNTAIFELEHKDEFYIDKSVIKEYKHKNFISMQVVMKHDEDALKIVNVLQELLESSDENE